MLRTSIFSKLWPTDSQVDSSQNKFLTCVQLEFRLPTHLRGIETTCVDFGRAQIFAQVDAGFSPFGHQTQVITSWSQVISMHAWNLRLYATCMNLRADLRIRLANHRKSVRCLLGFGNLRRLASPFGQGLSSDTSNGVDVQNGTIRNSYRASWMRNSAIHSEKNKM